VVTDPHCPPAIDRGDYNTLCHSLARSVIKGAKIISSSNVPNIMAANLKDFTI